MAGNVSNGGIGKSPVVDKLNQITAVNFEGKASEKLENLVYRERDILYQPVPIAFGGCKKELKNQISAVSRMKDK